MKRAINWPFFVALVGVSLLTGTTLWWLWRRSLGFPGEIRCGTSGYSVMSCNSDFGNYATVVVMFAAPALAWLSSTAFFTRFKGGQ